MQKNISSRLLTPRIKLNNKDVPNTLVYFTGNAISLLGDRSGSFSTDLENCTWHEDITSGTTLYIVTDINI